MDLNPRLAEHTTFTLGFDPKRLSLLRLQNLVLLQKRFNCMQGVDSASTEFGITSAATYLGVLFDNSLNLVRLQGGRQFADETH